MDRNDKPEDGAGGEMNAPTTDMLRGRPLEHRGVRGLIVIDRRAFTRACLAQWLTGFWADMATSVVADARDALAEEIAVAPAAAVLCAAEPVEHEPWLARQVELLRARHPDLPIALLVETDDLDAVEHVVGRLALHGYIPTTGSIDLLSAAMRVIVAGGTYFPRLVHAGTVSGGGIVANGQGAASTAPGGEGAWRCAPPKPGPAAAVPRLTPREGNVLDLLAQGLPNKLIAYQLEMSVSTVKVHVHHLIQKVGARNRTELALLARAHRIAEAPNGAAGA